MNILFGIMFLSLPCLVSNTAFAQEQDMKYTAQNRSVDLVKDGGRTVLQLSEGKGAGVAWIQDLEFSSGTIEFEVRGRDVMQKSFLGIAFHGIDSVNYESVYFRPFNFQAADPLRKIHAVQYCFEPRFNFQELRNTQENKYESAIFPDDIKPEEWFKVKLVIRDRKIVVFLNGSNKPCMEVESLNHLPSGKKIGFWVGNLSNGEFSGFKISE